MIDQNVPNPMAKNPNFNTTKVFAAIGIILIVLIIVVGGIWYFVQSAEDKAGTVDNSTVIKTASSSVKTTTISSKTSSKFRQEQIVKSFQFINSKGETKKLLIVSENGNTDTGYITNPDLSKNSAIKVKDPFTDCSAIDLDALRSCFGDSKTFLSPGPGKRFILLSRLNGDGTIFELVDETGIYTEVQFSYEALNLQDKCMCRTIFGSWKNEHEFYLKIVVESGNSYQVLFDAKTGKVEEMATKI